MKKLISNITKLYSEFWGIFEAKVTNNLNLQKLYKLGERINLYLKELTNLWENDLKNKKLDFENEPVAQLYSMFLREILWDKKKSDLVQRKINEEHNLQEFNKVDMKMIEKRESICWDGSVKIFNKDFIANILNAMKSYNKYVKNEINIDSLLDQLISLFSASVDYVKNIDRKAISFELINNLYKYLDDISNRNNNLKSIISKKKFKKEEFEIKEKENRDAAFNYQIEKLRKLLEEKDKELNLMSEKCINTSLNSRYYEQQVDILTAEKDASAKESKETKIINMELKNIINNQENMIRRLEKKLDAMDAKDAQFEENTKLIKDLENKINILMKEKSQNALKFKMLEDENRLIKKKFNELTKYTIYLEKMNNFITKIVEKT